MPSHRWNSQRKSPLLHLLGVAGADEADEGADAELAVKITQVPAPRNLFTPAEFSNPLAKWRTRRHPLTVTPPPALRRLHLVQETTAEAEGGICCAVWCSNARYRINPVVQQGCLVASGKVGMAVAVVGVAGVLLVIPAGWVGAVCPACGWVMGEEAVAVAAAGEGEVVVPEAPVDAGGKYCAA